MPFDCRPTGFERLSLIGRRDNGLDSLLHGAGLELPACHPGFGTSSHAVEGHDNVYPILFHPYPLTLTATQAPVSAQYIGTYCNIAAIKSI